MLKLSIVVPAYNVEQWLDATLGSVLACNSDEYEVLIIDDGSTDGTASIALDYQKKNPAKVRYIYKENGHYGSVVNRAMHEARGLYLRIVDGDDFVNAEAFELLLNSIDEIGIVDLILCDYDKLYVNKANKERVQIDMVPGVQRVNELERFPMFEMHAAVYRTDIFLEHDIKLTEGVPFTDQQYITYPLPFVQTVAYLPVSVYCYRLGIEGQSVSLVDASSKIDASRKVLSDLCDWFDALEIDKLLSVTRELVILLLMRAAANHMHLAIFLDLDTAIAEMKWVDMRVLANPILRGNDQRQKLIKGYGLMHGLDYRFTWLYKAVITIYKKIRGEL